MSLTRRYHLTLPLWLYAMLTIFVGSAAHTSNINLLFWVFGLMLSGLLISGLASGVMMMRLRTVRLDPRSGAVGEPLVVRYAVTNRNRFLPAFNIHVEELSEGDDDEESPGGGRRWRRRIRSALRAALQWPRRRASGAAGGTWKRLMEPAEAWIMHIGPRETVHGEAVFWPGRRGEARFNRLRLWTTFPFGIVKKSITISQPQHTLIYPRLHALRRGLLQSMWAEGPLGMKVSQRAGAGDDYYGMREYRPGDQLRHIAWKRAAGLDQLVCIERSQPNPPRVRIVIDLRAAALDPSMPGERQRDLQEQAISTGASLLWTADAAGYEAALSVLGADLPFIQLRLGHWHLAKMLAALASIDLETAGSEMGQPLPVGERAGLIVIHPDRVDPAVGRADAWHVSGRQLSTFVSDHAAAPLVQSLQDQPPARVALAQETAA